MSARIQMSVLRVPCEKLGIEDPWTFSEAHKAFFPDWGRYPHFAVAPTVRPFIDYILREHITDEPSFGKTRSLTAAERRKYEPAFQSLFPDIDMRNVRFVVFCWYDGCEAPDYYEGGSE